MAEQEEKSASIPWLPLVTLIGVGSGVLLFFPQLISSRPGGGDKRLAVDTFDDQTIDARLWQDPLGVAVADREKKQKDYAADFRKDSEAHSIGQFQKLLIKKCFAERPIYPLTQSTIYPLEEKLRFAEQAKQLQILAVMIPGGPYVEDVERRLRDRRAVIEGLDTAGYDPEKDHEIGYFCVPWQPLDTNVAACVLALEKNRKRDERRGFLGPGIQSTRSDWKETEARSLLVPYEWCEQKTFGPKKEPVHVLVLWLRDDAFGDAPLARLADLISWFRLRLMSAFQTLDFSALPVCTVLGPENSGTLRKMAMEAQDDPWNDDTRQCLTTTHIYSSQAAAAESRLLPEIPATDEPRIPAKREPFTCKNLIEQNVKRLASASGFYFERTNLLDDQIVETLWQELECRGLKKDDQVAVISEEDTYYARALRSTFEVRSVKGPPLANVHSYTYLRGIDGKLPADEKDQKETKDAPESSDKNAQSSLRPTERTEGLNQADDIRRLAQELRELDTKWRRKSGGHASLKAVGLLGSDVYDKLELLKALRPMLPEAVFFTNNLDARLAHPDEWNETHNLVVVSAFDLLLKPDQEVPPFRDSYQTALFAATLQAMGQIAAKPKSPFIFEIGRNGAKDITGDESISIAELFNLFKGCLLRLGCFIALGSFLLVWTYFVSRVTQPSSKAEVQAGDMKNERITFNESPGGNGRHAEEA